MKHTVATNTPPKPKFIPITFAVTFESAAEVKAFLQFHEGNPPERDGLSVEAYYALHDAARKQGINT